MILKRVGPAGTVRGYWALLVFCLAARSLNFVAGSPSIFSSIAVSSKEVGFPSTGVSQQINAEVI